MMLPSSPEVDWKPPARPIVAPTRLNFGNDNGLSGDELLQLLRPSGSSTSTSITTTTIVPPQPLPAVITALAAESRHEVVALVGNKTLSVNWNNWNRMRDESAADIDTPSLVISFLGKSSHCQTEQHCRVSFLCCVFTPPPPPPPP
jgi:hypothetical protein